jgi:uncharacterized protein (TIGR02284 family)
MPAMDNDSVVSTLNALIETCKDGEYGFRLSAEHLRSADVKRLFEQRAEECRSSAQELQRIVVTLGGNPDEGGSITGGAHRGWVAVKGTLAGYSDAAILEETERGEDAALARYRSALDESLPPDVMAVVRRQFEGVQRNHAQVRNLRDQARAVKA